MKDNFARNINYLRVSVTDRCNLRCVYCMPEEGVALGNHEDILSFEEILRVIRSGVRLGIRKIRLTGGEPLVRKGIVSLVSNIAAIPEIDDLALTTNGILLPQMARELKEAGLKRINISLDTLQPERYSSLTRCGRLEDVRAGIQAAFEAGFDPIKINSVIMRGFNDDEVVPLALQTVDRPLHLRYIEVMPVGETEEWTRARHVSNREIMEILEKRFGSLEPNSVAGNGPARYYKIPGALGTIGFIGAMSQHFCSECNRLRLTSEGKLRPCLQSPLEIDIRDALRRGAKDKELDMILRKVIKIKPQKHTMVEEGWGQNRRGMSQIGG